MKISCSTKKKKKIKKTLTTYLGFSEFEERFGSEIFSNQREDFKIADDSQAPEDYVLGLGDQIIVQYYGAESGEFILEIDRSGSILLPKIGPVILNGLNLEDARNLFAVELKPTCWCKRYNYNWKNKIYKYFCCRQCFPLGVYSMPALSRVTHALYIAGGISDLGTYRNIQVKRQGKIVGSVDLYDFLI